MTSPTPASKPAWRKIFNKYSLTAAALLAAPGAVYMAVKTEGPVTVQDGVTQPHHPIDSVRDAVAAAANKLTNTVTGNPFNGRDSLLSGRLAAQCVFPHKRTPDPKGPFNLHDWHDRAVAGSPMAKGMFLNTYDRDVYHCQEKLSGPTLMGQYQGCQGTTFLNLGQLETESRHRRRYVEMTMYMTFVHETMHALQHKYGTSGGLWEYDFTATAVNNMAFEWAAAAAGYRAVYEMHLNGDSEHFHYFKREAVPGSYHRTSLDMMDRIYKRETANGKSRQDALDTATARVWENMFLQKHRRQPYMADVIKNYLNYINAGSGPFYRNLKVSTQDTINSVTRKGGKIDETFNFLNQAGLDLATLDLFQKNDMLRGIANAMEVVRYTGSFGANDPRTKALRAAQVEAENPYLDLDFKLVGLIFNQDESQDIFTIFNKVKDGEMTYKDVKDFTPDMLKPDYRVQKKPSPPADRNTAPISHSCYYPGAAKKAFITSASSDYYHQLPDMMPSNDAAAPRVTVTVTMTPHRHAH